MKKYKQPKVCPVCGRVIPSQGNWSKWVWRRYSPETKGYIFYCSMSCMNGVKEKDGFVKSEK